MNKITHFIVHCKVATAIAACRCEGEVTIDGAKKSVKKSYPNFFEDYKALGGEIE